MFEFGLVDWTGDLYLSAEEVSYSVLPDRC